LTPVARSDYDSFANMRRIQFIELHEQPWFPRFLRDDITDTMQCALNFSAVYASIAPLFQTTLKSMGASSVVDLCSGAGGPWLDLARRLRREIAGFHVSLTDKFPNVAAFENVHEQADVSISFCEQPVDARQVPANLAGFRTMFSAFHHFAPAEARAIIRDTVAARQGIGIFEITRRTLPAIAAMIPWSLSPILFTPFVRPFRWSRLLFTYLVPVIPFVLLFDGIVSCLRTYRPSELSELVDGIGGTNYRWQAGEFRESLFKAPITYLIGFPCATAGD
jgi:hypothetical protein